MENFKTIFLNVFKKIVDFLAIIALILTVLAGSLAIFYDELTVIFETIGISQGSLGWMTVALGSFGTAGVILTRVSSGLKSAMLLAKTDQERRNASFERDMQTKIAGSEAYYEAKIARIEKAASEDRVMFLNKLESYENYQKKQDLFNQAQAEKYLKAPDRLVDEDTKKKYEDFLKNKKV